MARLRRFLNLINVRLVQYVELENHWPTIARKKIWVDSSWRKNPWHPCCACIICCYLLFVLFEACLSSFQVTKEISELFYKCALLRFEAEKSWNFTISFQRHTGNWRINKARKNPKFPYFLVLERKPRWLHYDYGRTTPPETICRYKYGQLVTLSTKTPRMSIPLEAITANCLTLRFAWPSSLSIHEINWMQGSIECPFHKRKSPVDVNQAE